MKNVLCIMTLVLAMLIITSCGGSNGNGSDPDTDIGTDDTDSDTESSSSINCTNTTYGYGKYPAESCFTVNDDGDILNSDGEVVESADVTVTEEGMVENGMTITEDLLRLVDLSISIPKPTAVSFSKKCFIVAIGRGNIPSAVTEDENGATCDANDIDSIAVSAGLIHKMIIPCDEPINPETLDNNTIDFSGMPFRFGYKGRFGTIKLLDLDTLEFDKDCTTVVTSWGSSCEDATHTSFYMLGNSKFDEDTFAFDVSCDEEDINDNGMLCTITIKDEEQAQFPNWITILVTKGDIEFEPIVPEVESFRLPVTDLDIGLNELEIIVHDNNDVENEQHTASIAVSVEIVDPCEGVDCNEPNGVCNSDNGLCDCVTGWNPDDNCATCADGFHPDGDDCVIDEVCLPGNASCNDNGTCADGTGVIICTCFTGYDGLTCDVCDVGYIGYPTCVDNPCDPDPCNGNGTCDTSDGSCDCDPGWLQPFCADPDLCYSTDCNGHGTCDPDDGLCDCVAGWDIVADCSVEDLCYTYSTDCNGHGTCDYIDGLCDCDADWDVVADCSVQDMCEGVTCDDNDVCNGLETCDPYTGCVAGTSLVCNDGLACNGVESCDSVAGCTNPPDVNCNSHGTCGEPSGSCSCDAGWDSATNCSACLTGFGGVNCDPVPVITDLFLDISGGIWPGHCVMGGYEYPVTFTVTNATSCSATVEKFSGTGTPGWPSTVTLIGNDGSFSYFSGSDNSQVDRITVNCSGAGGNAVPVYTDTPPLNT